MAQTEPVEDGKPNNASASDKAIQMVCSSIAIN